MSSLVVRCSPAELNDLTARAKSLHKSRAALIRALLWPESVVAPRDITPPPDITPTDITVVQGGTAAERIMAKREADPGVRPERQAPDPERLRLALEAQARADASAARIAAKRNL